MKTRNLVVVLIFIVIAVVAVAYVMKNSGPSQGETDDTSDKIVIELDRTETTETGETTEEPENAIEGDQKAALEERIEERLNPTPVPETEDNTIVFNEEFEMESGDFPVVKITELEAGARYSVYFETDKQIQFVAYNERFYNMWLETGSHTIAKATTNSVSSCCETSGSFTFDVNDDEGGNFYFVFDGAQIPDKSQLPKNGKLVVRINENI